MQSVRDRRQFLGQCALGSAMAAGGWWTGTNSVQAIEPIPRSGSSRFVFSLAAYSYRNLLKGKAAKLTLADFVDDCAAFQLDGTELTSYYFPQEITTEYIYALKQRCFRQGLDISGTAVGNDFGHPDSAQRKGQITHVKKWVDYAEMLGAPVIRIFAGKSKKGSTPQQSHSLMVAAIEECCAYAGEHGVHLALENHGGPTSTAAGLMAFVRDVKSPWFGINLDTGNFHTEDIYGDLEKVAPYCLNVQVKVTVSGPDRVKKPSDLKRLASMLRAANYRGYIVLEYEENGDPRTECRKYLSQLRSAFA
ncbi:MAG TPA: sugar phosphate isomerase/epimerase [Planctomycetaceae bacterium]|nr:sugar phosphate isomerase/epimerase [Planctomycetaceae bacterium]